MSKPPTRETRISPHGPYRSPVPTSARARRERSDVDLGGLLIPLGLLVAGLIPVISSLVTGTARDGGAVLGYAAVIAALSMIGHALTWTRDSASSRGGRGDERR
jgi:hypothetical protein